jgi:hypothetical protein
MEREAEFGKYEVKTFRLEGSDFTECAGMAV